MVETLRGNREGATKKADGPFSLLAPALFRLDQLLERAVDAAQAAYSAESAADKFRGLYISARDVQHLLRRGPGSPVFAGNSSDIGADSLAAGSLVDDRRWLRLRTTFGLSTFDLDVLLIGLAPEMDLRYERLYAYLQDDVTRRRPSVDLALNLLCQSPEEKLISRTRFSAESPLVSQKLIHLFADPNHVQPPLLSHYFKIEEQIVSLLLDQESLDARLADFCRLMPAAPEETFPESIKLERLVAFAREAQRVHQSRVLCFDGPARQEKLQAASALACALDVPLLVADLSRLPEARQKEFEGLLHLLKREAWRRNAMLCLDEVDSLSQEQLRGLQRALVVRTPERAAPLVICCCRDVSILGPAACSVTRVSFATPGYALRKSWWRSKLEARGLRLEDKDLEQLAVRFRVTGEQIVGAVESAFNQACLASDEHLKQNVALPGLYAAVRANSAMELAGLAQKLEPRYGWDSIVLPQDSVRQLEEICICVTQRQRVLEDWGFGQKLSQGKGTHALFSGASGTGKTMAAEVVAKELGFDLYRVDLSGVVSKYIGETEKNLDRIFTAAQDTSAVLFFDEADALFGKRSEVRDSHDRYANLEISYLLLKMEQYDGIAILASNLRANLDEAFLRRLTFVVSFPFPDETQRLRIWQGIWPQETPLSADVDLGFLAHEYKFTGGNIKNVALAAAFLAAEDGSPVTMSHLLQAVRREYQKLGKSLPALSEHLAVGDIR